MNTSRSTISTIAIIAGVLQLLFPPKVWIGPFGTQSLGFHFIFSDPMRMANSFAADMARTSINWTQLLIQLVVTGGVAVYAAKRAEG